MRLLQSLSSTFFNDEQDVLGINAEDVLSFNPSYLEFETTLDFDNATNSKDFFGHAVSSNSPFIPTLPPIILDAVVNGDSGDNNLVGTIINIPDSDINISGTSGNDNLVGTAGDDVIDGLAGNDVINGLAGDDVLNGGAGNDQLIGSAGADQFNGGSGFDVVDYRGVTSAVIVNIATGVTAGDAAGDTYSGIEAIFGSNFNDTITGDADTDELRGFDGDDVLEGGSNFDSLYGGNGDDLFIATAGFLDQYFGGAGNDTISFVNIAFDVTVDIDDELATFSTSDINFFDIENLTLGSGDDTVIGDNGVNVLDGGAGDDLITGLDGNDIINGGAGTDYAVYSGVRRDYSITENPDGTFTVTDLDGNGDGSDILTDIEFARFADIDVALVRSGTNLTPNNDVFSGTAGDDIINGLAGNDVINGLAGDDVINGDEGADLLIGGLGADTLNGGDGFDSVDYRGATSGVRLDVASGGTFGEALGDSFSGIERYFLSDFNDIVTGSDANEFFFGQDGNDTINGGGGVDRIDGGDGDDIQRGQDGNDTLFGSAGADQLNGGTGIDVATYALATSAVELNLSTGGTVGDAAGDTYFGIELVFGSDFDDVITGNNSVNDLRGGDGDDTLNGGGGNDRLFGGEGADAFDGGAGLDIANYTTTAAAVTLDLASGGTAGEAAGDTFTSIEWVFGSDFDDSITGDAGNNRLEGRDGNDTLNGAAGNDRLLGGDGADTINGGDGVDTIFGQSGSDFLFGDAGNDFFFGSDGGDAIDGGADFDTVSYLPSTSGVTLNLQTGGTAGDAAGDTYTNIERAFGTSFDDSITGSDSDDVLLGNGGSDYLAGGAGQDTLLGGAGIDSFGYDTTADGNDFINDFFGGETIFILGGDTAFDTFAELQAVATDVGGNVRFDFGSGNTLTVIGRNIADLDAGDFDFGGTSSILVSESSGAPSALESIEDSFAFASELELLFDMDALL